MSVDFVLEAEMRNEQGKGASRRLRRAGKVPVILYGADKEPLSIMLDQNEVLHNLEREAFYSQILSVKLDGNEEKVFLKDLQRHPAKRLVLHMDLLRVSEDQEIRVTIPLHFINEHIAPGVKLQGGAISHLLTEVEVECLPANLPEYIEVDMANQELNESIRLSGLKLPEGVSIVELSHGMERDQAVVNVHPIRGVIEETDEVSGEEDQSGDESS